MNLIIEKGDLVGVNNSLLKKELLLRSLSSIFLITIAVAFNILGSFYFFSLILLLQIIILKEFYDLFYIKTSNIGFYFSCLVLIITSSLGFLGYFYHIIIPFLLAISISSFYYKKNYLIISFSYVYINAPALILIYLNNYKPDGHLLILQAFVIVWSADIAAYIFGNIIKGPKLWKKISPNKTWSGFFCSIFIAGIASLIFCYVYKKESHIYWFLIGIITALFSSFGDLLESYFKRINNKKNSSNLLPGHGGLLDRLDGFLIAIVIYWPLTLFR